MFGFLTISILIGSEKLLEIFGILVCILRKTERVIKAKYYGPRQRGERFDISKFLHVGSSTAGATLKHTSLALLVCS